MVAMMGIRQKLLNKYSKIVNEDNDRDKGKGKICPTMGHEGPEEGIEV